MKSIVIVDMGEKVSIKRDVDSLEGVNLSLNAIFAITRSDGLPRSVVAGMLRACANDIER